MSIPEAAEFLRCSEKTLRNKISSGVFVLGVDFFRPRGTRPLFKRRALEEYVEGRRPVAAGLLMAAGYELGSGGR